MEKINFPKYSDNIKRIFDYFNKFEENNSLNLETAPLAGTLVRNNEATAIEILNNIFKKLQKYVNEDEKIILSIYSKIFWLW